MKEPAPVASMPLDVRRALRGVLTDIDDTLTSAGILGPFYGIGLCFFNS